jgi:hypothetical protein
MLTSEFATEIGTLIRSLQQRVLMEPVLQQVKSEIPPLDHIERAIATLVALHVALRKGTDEG